MGLTPEERATRTKQWASFAMVMGCPSCGELGDKSLSPVDTLTLETRCDNDDCSVLTFCKQPRFSCRGCDYVTKLGHQAIDHERQNATHYITVTFV